MDAAGRVVARFEARHAAAGLADLLARPREIAPAAESPIAIERPSGLIVDALVEALSPFGDITPWDRLRRWHPVVPIHPDAVEACRPRYRAAGGKSDPGDARMLADVLRTGGHRFRPLTPVSDEIKAPRASARGRDDPVGQRVAPADQPRPLPEGFRPGAAAVSAAIDGPIAPAFVNRYPTPDSAARLGERRVEPRGSPDLAGFLARRGYCGRRTPAGLLARLRAAPDGLAGGAEAEAKGEVARALAGSLERPVAEVAKPTSRVERAVAELPDGGVVMSFPRAGRIRAARILAELGDVRERFPTEGRRAAEAGVRPVAHAPGESRGAAFRWACNKNLRAALTCFADNSRHACARAAAIHDKARSRGCKHPHAVRILARACILARAWVRVLRRAWKDAKPYGPERHTAARKLAA